MQIFAIFHKNRQIFANICKCLIFEFSGSRPTSQFKKSKNFRIFAYAPQTKSRKFRSSFRCHIQFSHPTVSSLASFIHGCQLSPPRTPLPLYLYFWRYRGYRVVPAVSCDSAWLSCLQDHGLERSGKLLRGSRTMTTRYIGNPSGLSKKGLQSSQGAWIGGKLGPGGQGFRRSCFAGTCLKLRRQISESPLLAILICDSSPVLRKWGERKYSPCRRGMESNITRKLPHRITNQC